jgi:hypothetical protein
MGHMLLLSLPLQDGYAGRARFQAVPWRAEWQSSYAARVDALNQRGEAANWCLIRRLTRLMVVRYASLATASHM